MINYHLIIVALLFVLLDIVTGVLQSFINGNFKSSIMRKGGVRKLFLIVVIVFGVLLDFAQTIIELGFNVPACSGICAYIILMEIMSVIENINMGFPGSLPPALIRILNQSADQHEVKRKDETDN